MNRSLDFVFTMMIISYFIDFFHFFDFLPFPLFADAAVFCFMREKQMAGKFKIALCNVFQDRAK